MSNTNSISFPYMFDVARNRVGMLSDTRSVVNRTRLLMYTEPTELYNSPNFGVGLKKSLFQYNTDNQKAIIKDRIIEQLRLHEPYVNPDGTQFADGLIFTGSNDTIQSAQEYNKLKLTVALQCVFGTTAEVTLTNE